MKLTLMAWFLLLMAAVMDSAEVSVSKSNAMSTMLSEEPLGSVWDSIEHVAVEYLKLPGFQRLNAACALIVGSLLLCDPELITRWIMIVAIGTFAMLITLSELDEIIGQGWGFMHELLALVVFSAASFGAWQGFEVINMVIGAFLGLFVAHELEGVVAWASSSHGLLQPLLLLLWQLAGLVGGALWWQVVLQSRHYDKFQATVAPLAGGALVSSVVSWLAMTAELHGRMTFFHKLIPDLQPGVHAPWYKYFEQLFSRSAEEVGILAHNNVTHIVNLDRLMGLLLWLLLFVLGSGFQYRALQVRRKRKRVVAARSLAEPSASLLPPPIVSGGLSQPLLEEAAA